MCDTAEIVSLLEKFLKESLEICESQSKTFDANTLVENVFTAFLNNNTYFQSQNIYEVRIFLLHNSKNYNPAEELFEIKF